MKVSKNPATTSVTVEYNTGVKIMPVTNQKTRYELLEFSVTRFLSCRRRLWRWSSWTSSEDEKNDPCKASSTAPAHQGPSANATGQSPSPFPTSQEVAHASTPTAGHSQNDLAAFKRPRHTESGSPSWNLPGQSSTGESNVLKAETKNTTIAPTSLFNQNCPQDRLPILLIVLLDFSNIVFLPKFGVLFFVFGTRPFHVYAYIVHFPEGYRYCRGEGTLQWQDEHSEQGEKKEPWHLSWWSTVCSILSIKFSGLEEPQGPFTPQF